MKIASAAGEAMGLFVSFRPSDREVLRDLSTTNRPIFIASMQEYLSRWEAGDWVDDYAIEQIGRWIGRNCGQDVVQSLHDYAKTQIAGLDVQLANAAPMTTYRAFINGLETPQVA